MAKLGKVRPLALAVIRHGDSIFVTESYDAIERQAFCRPLGGGIEFGERGAETVVRELKEEIGAEITVVCYLGAFENIFTYAGRPGHEIILLYAARFVDPMMCSRERVEGVEPDDGSGSGGVWKPLASFGPELPLYPDGLLDLLAAEDDR